MINLVTAFTGGLSAIDFALKYENLKYIHLMACEIDKYARKQFLEFHQSPLSFPEDVSLACGKHLKGKVDLYCFGSPCQDLSLAGKRAGFDGQKSSLFRHGARLLKEMQPKVFIFENVKGLLSSNKGADYAEVIKTFQDMGYLIQMKVLNAKEHGTAQNRERVFIVGFLDEEAYHAFSFEDAVPLTKTLRDYLDDEVEEKYYLSDKMIKGFISSGVKHKEKGNGFEWKPKQKDEIANCLRANCLRANGALNSSDNSIIEPIKVKSATACGYELATENDSINFTHPSSKTRRGRVGKGVAQTLDCACNQGVLVSNPNSLIVLGNTVPFGHQAGKVYHIDGLCPTVMHNNNKVVQISVESMVSKTIKESVRKNFVRDYEEIIKSDKSIFYSDCESGFQDNKVCLTESACLRANNSDLFTLDRPFRIRRLIPRECGRLMGMRDEDVDKIYKKETFHFQLTCDKISSVEIKQKDMKCNAKLLDVNEMRIPINMESYVLCTISEKIGMEVQMKNLNLTCKNIKNVNFVMKKLGKVEQKECVQNTIKWIDCTETLFMLIQEEKSQAVEVIFVQQMVNQSIDKSWKIILEENLSKEKLFITLTVLKQIIQSKIFTYVKTEANISISINNLKELSPNLLEIKLSTLKMEYIQQSNSDTMLYKIFGNGIEIKTIRSIVRALYKPVKKLDTLF